MAAEASTVLKRREPKIDRAAEAERVVHELLTRGTTVVRAPPSGAKRRESIILKNVNRSGKGIVAEVINPGGIRSVTGAASNAKVLVFFPTNKEHARLFALNQNILFPGGPSSLFPGSVGSLKYSRQQFPKTSAYDVHWIQGHFKTSSAFQIPRKIATLYGGWSTHLLNVLFERAANAFPGKHKLVEMRFMGDEEALRKLQPKGVLFEKIAKSKKFDVSKDRSASGLPYAFMARRKPQ
ncbi:MAG TPA: hypothetical protein VGQ00_01155 [Candidatus Norongarragalinales archaeon]|jgi:hypothetical protein|nr:hypothetical protein [Candidatus Norongarragalinales archaeon]